jgi:hypothetical protein
MWPTRRQFVAGAGAALVVPATASAADGGRVGVAPDGREAIGVIGTILQEARRLTGFGYVTPVAGMKPADLFTNPASRGAPTARLRWHAEVTVSTIDVLPELFYGTGTAACGCSSPRAAGRSTASRTPLPQGSSLRATRERSATSRSSTPPTTR